MKLRHKTLLFITPFIIIPILMIGVAAYYNQKVIAEERFNTQVTTLLNQISQYLRHNVEVAEANLHLLADHQLVNKYALTDDESIRYELLLPHLLNVFKNIQTAIDDYYEIRLILPDGFEEVRWAADGIANIKEDIRDETYFHDLELMEDDVFKRVIFDDNTQQHALLLVRKLVLSDPTIDAYGKSPKLRGYLAITVSLNYLRSEINKNVIGDAGFISVMNDQGEFIISPDRQIPGLSQEQITLAINSKLQSHLDKPIPFSFDLNNTPLLLHLKSLPGDLTLLGVLPEQEISNSSRDLGKLIVIITIIAIIVTMVSVFFALQHLVLNPIATLNTAARSIGNGYLDLEIDINSRDEIGSLANSFTEMSKNLKQTHAEVSYTANHDALTGLPNRSMFQKHLSNILRITKQKNQKLALLFLDLDDFKNINDALGHQAGDVLLQEVASRLSGALRNYEFIQPGKYTDKAIDLVARLGGDEFIILLNDIEGPFDATSVADRVLQNLKDPVEIYGKQVYVNSSIGITLYPDDTENSDDLIKFADIAMYHAKDQGKNHYQFYSHQLNVDLQNRLQMNSHMRHALDRNLFFLHYQPKIETRTGKIMGLEALIRWNDPKLGAISPAVFIPIAEESGLITPITEWVLNEVCRQCKAWLDSGLNIVPVAVNVSSIQFKRRDLTNMIKTALNKTGLAPEYLEIELIETSLLTDTKEAAEILRDLSDLNVKVALDDFGTGYSSLSYLNDLPIQTLKIDRSFIKNIVEVDQEYAIVDAIIVLAHALDLQVIAEGVETTIQLEYLKDRSCDQLQGYLINKPLPNEQIPKLLKNLSGLENQVSG